MSAFEPKVVFITGTGRCGTNFLKEELGKDRQIAILPFEHRFTIDPDGIIDTYNSLTRMWSPFMQDKKVRRLEKYLKSLSKMTMKKKILKIFKKVDYDGWELNKWFPEYDKLVDNFIKDLSLFKYKGRWPGNENSGEIYFCPSQDIKLYFQKFLYQLINNLLDKSGKTVFVEDNTWSILYMDQLLELFPNAKFVIPIRNQDEVIHSFTQQSWMPDEEYLCKEIYEGLVTTSIIHNDAFIEEKNMLRIDFKELTKQTDKTIKTVKHFIFEGGKS